MFEPFILFDVGANFGVDSLDKTRDNPNYRTYAFEPTPFLIGHLQESSRPFADRYTITPKAVSDFNGKATFNVAGHNDWGCSSLLTFSEGLDKTWAGREDFFADSEIEVDVIRLDSWLMENPIKYISFFHCDTQGSDLKVLQGMGPFVQLIEDGVIEVPQSKEVMLYKDQHTKEEAMDFLSDWGFEVYQTVSQQNEDNIFFRPK